MIKIFAGLFILTLTNTVLSQNPVFFEQQGDTTILYLNCNGSITTKDNACFKRVVLFEKKRLAFQGNVVDYYFPNGATAFKAHYEGGRYEGLVKTYFADGTIKETGKYKNDNRDSIWTFYYNNGHIEKKINYSNVQPRILEYYHKNGKPAFLDGNGFYKGLTNVDNSSNQYAIKGELKNGLMTGKWKIRLQFSVCTEVFENGKFISGYETPHNRFYDSGSMINPEGYPYYENIAFLNRLIASNNNVIRRQIDDNDPIMNKYSVSYKSTYSWPIYDDDPIFAFRFTFELYKIIRANFNINDFFYSLMEFQIEDGKINPGSIKAITNDNENFIKLKTLLLGMDKWNKLPGNESFTVYLPIFWENGYVYLEPGDIAKFN
jgi:antitoxin component YwqK of YwqJK toxin-antitoxin module